MRRRIGIALAGLALAAAAIVAIFHDAAVELALPGISTLATGYTIGVSGVRLGSGHGALTGVRVTRGGQPVLAARRIDLYYALRDLLPGSSHRFGLRAVTIDRPRITLIHNANGSYNVALPNGAPQAAAPRVPSVPLALTIRIRDGIATLDDTARYYKESRAQRADHIDADVSIDTAGKTRYVVTGDLEDSGPQPFRAAGAIDVARGYALHHVTVRAIPIRTVGNYFIDSPAAEILGGMVRGLDVRMYAFDVRPNAPAAYHVIGNGKLSDGEMLVRGLDSPIRAITGPITLFDGGFAARDLSATVGSLPVRVAGGIFDFRNPQFRLGVQGRGDLSDVKKIVAFARGLPIRGGVAIHALIEGAIANPLLLIGFGGSEFRYQDIPVDNPRGDVALYGNSLVVLPFHGTYDGLAVHMHGELQLGPHVRSVLTMHAEGPSTRLPYLGALVPDQPIATEALLSGTDLRIDARGYIVSLTHPADVSGFYRLDRSGRGEFGPIAIRTPFGGRLAAELDVDRPNGNSAFWASVQNVRLRQPAPILLPGVGIPELPPIDAAIRDAEIAGTGSARNTVVGGVVDMANATIAGVPFDGIRARFAGPFAQADMSSVQASGPWGSFSGDGSFAPSSIVARGNYTGTLQGLRPFIGSFPASGGISGPMAIAIANGNVFVQARDARLSGATIHGIPISSVAGTLSFQKGVLKIYSARARAAGGTVVAAGSFGGTARTPQPGLAIATTVLDAGALHALGVPLQSGRLQSAGTIVPGGALPGVNAGVVVREARAAGYGPFDASANVAIAADALNVGAGVVALNDTFAETDGTIDGLSAGAPRYDLHAVIPVGSIQTVAAIARIPTDNAQGVFNADVLIGGAGTDPSVRGIAALPVGSVNGLGFADARAALAATRAGVALQDGSVTVGTTHASFAATLAKGETAISVRSPRADFSDFNDYFDTGDTLAGVGPLAFAFTRYDGSIYTSGNVDVAGMRYRRLPIGDTSARWTSLRGIARGTVAVGGAQGRLLANGSIRLGSFAGPAQLAESSDYNVTSTLSNVDLGTWLAAFGFPQAPVTGRFFGSARVTGSYPHLSVSGNGSIRGGTLGPLPIQRADFVARSSGDRIAVTSLDFALPALSATGSGSFGFARSAPLNFTVHAVSDDLAHLIAEISKKQIAVTGHLETTATLTGTMHAPALSAVVAGTNVDVAGIKIPSLVSQVALRGRDVVLRNADVAFEKGRVTLAGALPLQLRPFGIGPPSAPIAMDLAAEKLDVSAFSPFLGDGAKAAGTLDGHVGVSGTIGSPLVYGGLALQNGSYVSKVETTPVTATVARMTFSGTHATLDRLQARPGSGTLDGTGTLDFGGGLHGGPLGYSLAIVTKGAQISMPQYGSGSIDSHLSLRRARGGLAQLSGTAALSNAILPFAAFLNFGGGAAGTAAGPPFDLGLNLRILAGKNVSVRGGGAGLFGLEISATGSALLAGTLRQPTLAGRFTSAGGTLTYIDHAFKVQSGSVSFDPANGVIPDINAVGTTHIINPDPNSARNPSGTADITVTVTGPVTSPKIAFESNPAGYTQQQIVAMLLPLGGLVGPIQFTDTGVILPPGQLNGAPAPDVGGLLPSILVRRQNGTLTVGQEAFSILNAQFANGLLAPLESALGSSLGLTDVNLTLDYTGNFGINFRRILAKDFYAVYGTTLGVPVRQTFGFAYQPNTFTSVQFTMFVQEGEFGPFLTPGAAIQTNTRAAAGQAVQGTSGFTFLYQRLF